MAKVTRTKLIRMKFSKDGIHPLEALPKEQRYCRYCNQPMFVPDGTIMVGHKKCKNKKMEC